MEDTQKTVTGKEGTFAGIVKPVLVLLLICVVFHLLRASFPSVRRGGLLRFVLLHESKRNLMAPFIEPGRQQISHEKGIADPFVHASEPADGKGDQSDDDSVNDPALRIEGTGHVIGRHEHGAEQKSADVYKRQG